ncbi:PucR family transcriptional regulator ligand-binding domain-containing protein [Streptomyces thinghirensis]|nr:PucR family transcriptional regulator ligand-binding domain-containing protein [Streptomyces thinghirensis]
MRQNRHRSFRWPSGGQDHGCLTVRPPPPSTQLPKARRPHAPHALASLVHHSALKLTVRAGEDRLDVPVRWAHVSELADPCPTWRAGNCLLFTALKLDAADPEAMHPVREAARGRRGGWGSGSPSASSYDDIPEALVEAARQEGLPLLEVPRRTPFLAISKAVSAAIAADQYRAVTAGFAAQRKLTRRALTDGPEGCWPRWPGRSTAGRRCATPPGAVVAAAPEWAGRRAARLTADVERLRERPAPAPSVVGGAEHPEHPRERRPRRTPLLGTSPQAPLRARRRHRRRPRHRRAVRRPLGHRPALDAHHGTLALPARGRAAHRRRRTAHAAGRRT